MSAIHGLVADGWQPVADAFDACFTDHNELGAAVAVYVGGHCMVDLWGGVADAASGRPWRRDTVVPVFSTTKGLTALCAHILVERGRLDLEAPVARYWPEFAAGGKRDIPVRWLLSHQAGLPFVDRDLSFDELAQEEPVVRALAEQEPLWEPGRFFAYHAVTYGHLVGELVRRVTGQTLPEFLSAEVIEPLGLSAWLGLPRDADVDLAVLERTVHDTKPVPPPMIPAQRTMQRAISLGGAIPEDLLDERVPDFNDRSLLAVPLGGSNMVTDARSLARAYASTVSDVDGVRLLSPEGASRAAVPQTTDVPYFEWPPEYAPLCPFQFALGFAPGSPLGTDGFGHGGAGGSTGWADRGGSVGFGYVMNRMEASVPDLRATSLAEAVAACLRADTTS